MKSFKFFQLILSPFRSKQAFVLVPQPTCSIGETVMPPEVRSVKVGNCC